MRSNILKQLLEMHATGDEVGFRKAALQLASAESAAGHIRVAEEIRALVDRLPATGRRTSALIDIAAPRGELADILEGGHRDERLRDIVLSSETRHLLERVLVENRSRAALERWGVGPRRRLLFHGPPGCGKTLAASVVAGELGLPLMTVRLDALFSRFLGATANHLRSVFAEMPKRPGVYLFDEFDSVAKARGDPQDVGEMRRVVTAFLQLADADRSNSILIAATNHSELLDRAVFRRFDLIVPFEQPNGGQISELVQLRLRAFAIPDALVHRIAAEHPGISYADAARACDDAIRTMALSGREDLTDQDLLTAFAHAANRTPIQHS